MDQDLDFFVLDPRCRLCRSPDATGGRTFVNEKDHQQRRLVSEMISSCTAVKIYDHDRLPQHVCGPCLEKLREAYALWQRCLACQKSDFRCQAGKEDEFLRCRICHAEECDELFSLDCPGRVEEAPIGDMLLDFANVMVVPGDGLAAYVCDGCLELLERARVFKRECLQAEVAFLNDTIHAWEKMEFQEGQPSHLVVELFAKPIFETPKLVRCSVCSLKRPIRQIAKHCEGCKLDFDGLEPSSECETDEKVELLVVVDSGNDEESEVQAKRPRMADKKQSPVKRVVSQSSAKTMQRNQEDPNAVHARSISRNLTKLNQKIEQHFQIVSSPPGATYQTMRLKSFLCCGCNRFLINQEAFRKHLREFHPKPTIQSEFVCGICNSAFGSKKLLLAHRDKLGARLYNYCKICDIVLLEERSFVRHQMMNHLTDRQLKEIEQQFIRNVTTKCRSVESVPDGDATCDDCGKSFATEEDLSGHRYESFQFTCQQKGCSYVTKNREFMIVHCVVGDHSKQKSESTTSIVEEPPKELDEDTFMVELEDGVEDADSDWEPDLIYDTEWIRPDSVKRQVTLQFPSKNPSKPQLDEDAIAISSCRANLEKRSLRMEDVFELLETNPSGIHQYVRRKTPFCCGCNRFVLSNEAFLKHLETFHPKKPTDSKFVCHICHTSFTVKKNFKAHIDKKDCHVYNYCKPCDKIVLDEKTYVKHQLSVHLTNRQKAELEKQIAPVTVKRCTYHSRISFSGLMGKRTNFRCNFCRRYFASQASLDGHMQDVVEYACLAEGCEIQSRHRQSMIVHCSLGNHRQQPRGEMKELNFRQRSMLFDEALPVAAERVEDLSQVAIPMKQLRIFLKGNSLQMEDIFGIQKDIDNQYVHCIKLLRKKPLCCACNLMFMSEQALSSHMQSEHTERPEPGVDPELVCKLCYTVFGKRALLKFHTDRLQTKSSQFTYCKLCDAIVLAKSFTRHNFKRHLTDEKMSELEGQFTAVSSYGCRDADSLTEIDEGRYKCACKCGKKFESILSARAHQAGSQDVMLYCKVEGCRFQTSKKMEIFEHCMEEAHEVPANPEDQEADDEICFSEREMVYFKCCFSRCFRKFAAEDSLLAHFATHAPAPADLEPNTCHICGETFSSDEDFLAHMDRRYTVKMFRCVNKPCKYQSEFLPNVQLHYRSCKGLVLRKAWKCPKDKIPEHLVKVGQLDEMIDIIEGKGPFCCGCRQVLGSEAELQEHLQREHATRDPARPLHCPTCNKGFKLKSFLENHMRESAERRYYHCRICKTLLLNELQVKHHKTYIHAFEDPSELTEFYDTITSDLLPCCGCDAKFATQDELALHCSLAHPAPSILNRLLCPNCHLQQSSLKSMTSHCAKYGSKTYYKCKIGDCRLQTKILSIIQRHVSAASHEDQGGSYRKYLENQQTFYCCVVNCTFSSELYDLLIDHGIAEHAKEREHLSAKRRDRPLTCPVCCKGFNEEKQMINHRNGAILVACEICKNKTPAPDFAAHLEECRRTYSKACPHCPEVFATYGEFVKHNNQLHGHARPKKKVVCSICGMLVVENILADHIASHENKRAWKCNQCSLAFNTKTNLSLHERRVHTTERKYRCTVVGCDKTYRYDIDRVRHENVVHFNLKPFACAECPEAFVRNRDLQLHMRLHTGRKLYTCQRCRAEYDRKSEFVAHQERCGEARYDEDVSAYEEYIEEEIV